MSEGGVLKDIQDMIDALEVGWIFDKHMNLTELGLFVNKLEQMIHKADPTLKQRFEEHKNG